MLLFYLLHEKQQLLLSKDCHGGPGRALAAERIIGGFERNWPADLRVDTMKANHADKKHEADALLLQK